LIPAARLLNDLTQVLRLCVDGAFEPEAAPHGLKELLGRVADAPSFDYLESTLRGMLAETAALFDQVVS
jgi:glutamate-ammonia-ligase adenylyltransferase